MVKNFNLGINFEMSKVVELLTSVNMGEYLDKARKTVSKKTIYKSLILCRKCCLWSRRNWIY